MPKSLLVADDSLTIRKVIGMIFATEDFQITSVDNGLEAISKVRDLRPDLVLADVTMPGRSGYEVCEAIKADPNTQNIPVLLLAGTFEPFDENRARAVKADDYIVKPFESQALLDKVRTLAGLPRTPETPRQVFVPESASPGGRPPSPPTPSPRSAAPGSAPTSSTFPGGGGPPRPSAPAYSIGQSAPARPSAMPAAASGPRPAMPHPSQPAFSRPPPPASMNPGYPNPGPPSGPGMPQYRPPPSAIPRPGPGMGSSAPGMQGVPPGGYAYRPGAPSPQPMRAPVPMPSQGFARTGPGPTTMPRSAYGAGSVPPRVDPYAAQAYPQMRPVQPHYGPTGGYHPSQYGQGVPAPGYPAAPPPSSLPSADGGEALLREALSKASREVIEKIAWEIVPQLAETIIREHLDQLVKDREGRT